MDISSISGGTTSPSTAKSTEETSAAQAGSATPVGAPPAGGKGGGAPMIVSTEDETSETTLQAALAKAQVLVGASEAENVVNDDGSIDYAALARILAEQAAKQQTQDRSSAAINPAQILNILS